MEAKASAVCSASRQVVRAYGTRVDAEQPRHVRWIKPDGRLQALSRNTREDILREVAMRIDERRAHRGTRPWRCGA